MKVHFHIFPKCVLWFCSCSCFLNFCLDSQPLWYYVWYKAGEKKKAPVLPKLLYSRNLNCHFSCAVHCVEYEGLLILLEVKLGKTNLKNTWTGLRSIQNILPIYASSWKIKKHLFSSQMFSARLFLQKSTVPWLSSEKSKHFSFWPGGKCFTEPVCSRYSQTQKLIIPMKLEVKSSFLLFHLSEWKMHQSVTNNSLRKQDIPFFAVMIPL